MCDHQTSYSGGGASPTFCPSLGPGRSVFDEGRIVVMGKRLDSLNACRLRIASMASIEQKSCDKDGKGKYAANGGSV
jgi:hypothetical protein